MVSRNGNAIFQPAKTLIFRDVRVWILQESVDVLLRRHGLITFLYLDS